MERTKTVWLSTKDIAARWQCANETVSRRLKRAGVAQVTTWGRTNFLRLEDVVAVENALGVADIVASLNSGDDE